MEMEKWCGNEVVTLAMRTFALIKLLVLSHWCFFGFVIAICSWYDLVQFLIYNKVYEVTTFRLYAFALPAVLMIISLTIYLLKVKLKRNRCMKEIVAELENKLK